MHHLWSIDTYGQIITCGVTGVLSFRCNCNTRNVVFIYSIVQWLTLLCCWRAFCASLIFNIHWLYSLADQLQRMYTMNVLAHMPIIVIITRACVHVAAKKRAFSSLTHFGICAFTTGVFHLDNKVSTSMNAGYAGNTPGVRSCSLQRL